MEFATNVVYIVVDIDVNNPDQFKPFVACRTENEAKNYLTSTRQMFGPIPIVDSMSFKPSVPTYQPEPNYLPSFPKLPHGPFSTTDPYYGHGFSRPRLPRHPDASFSGN